MPCAASRSRPLTTAADVDPLAQEVQVEPGRLVLAVEPLGVELGEAGAPLLPLVGRVGQGQEPLGDGGHLFPPAEVGRRRAQLLQRQHAVGVELEDLPVHLRRRRRVRRRRLQPPRLGLEPRAGIAAAPRPAPSRWPPARAAASPSSGARRWTSSQASCASAGRSSRCSSWPRVRHSGPCACGRRHLGRAPAAPPTSWVFDGRVGGHLAARRAARAFDGSRGSARGERGEGPLGVARGLAQAPPPARTVPPARRSAAAPTPPARASATAPSRSPASISSDTRRQATSALLGSSFKAASSWARATARVLEALLGEIRQVEPERHLGPSILAASPGAARSPRCPPSVRPASTSSSLASTAASGREGSSLGRLLEGRGRLGAIVELRQQHLPDAQVELDLGLPVARLGRQLREDGQRGAHVAGLLGDLPAAGRARRASPATARSSDRWPPSPRRSASAHRRRRAGPPPARAAPPPADRAPRATGP